jgi:hypothetical protein
MKWFKRMVVNWVKDDWNSTQDDLISGSPKRRIGIGTDDIDSDQGLNITVRNATGGRIVTFRRYDNRTDRHQHNLYVIPEDHNFEQELGKLITLESLRG